MRIRADPDPQHWPLKCTDSHYCGSVKKCLSRDNKSLTVWYHLSVGGGGGQRLCAPPESVPAESSYFWKMLTCQLPGSQLAYSCLVPIQRITNVQGICSKPIYQILYRDISQGSRCASGSLWDMSDLISRPLNQPPGAIPMSHHICPIDDYIFNEPTKLVIQ